MSVWGQRGCRWVRGRRMERSCPAQPWRAPLGKESLASKSAFHTPPLTWHLTLFSESHSPYLSRPQGTAHTPPLAPGWPQGRALEALHTLIESLVKAFLLLSLHLPSPGLQGEDRWLCHLPSLRHPEHLRRLKWEVLSQGTNGGLNPWATSGGG